MAVAEKRTEVVSQTGRPSGRLSMLRRVWHRVTRPFFYHVIVHVTDRCNLRCKTCFVEFGRKDLSVAEARVLSEKLGPMSALDIGGGEPFLHRDLLAVIKEFRFRTLTIPTNGQFQQKVVPIAATLAKQYPGRVTIALSLDGLQEINDGIRGPGTFEKAMETYHALRAIPGLILKVNTVINNRNLHQAVEMADYIRTLRPDYHSLLLLRGDPLAPEEVELPPLEALEAITPELLRIARSYDYGHPYNVLFRWLKGNYQEYMWRSQLRMLRNRQAPFQCRAPWLNKVVYPNGELSMCELKPRLGNLLEEDAAELDARLHDHLADFERENGKCFCTHNCHMSENIGSHVPSVFRILTGRVR